MPLEHQAKCTTPIHAGSSTGESVERYVSTGHPLPTEILSGHSATVGLSTGHNAFPRPSASSGLSTGKDSGQSAGRDSGQSAGTASGISMSAAKHAGLSKKHPSQIVDQNVKYELKDVGKLGRALALFVYLVRQCCVSLHHWGKETFLHLTKRNCEAW